MYVFLAIVITITGLIHWFLYGRLISALDITSPALLWTLRSLAVFLSQSYLISRILERSYDGFGLHALEWTASVWIGFMWQFLWMSLLLYVVKIILIASGVWIGFGGETQLLIGRYTFLVVVGMAFLLNGCGYYRAASPARVNEVRVPVANPSSELRQMKIAMVADFHASTTMTADRIARYCEQITDLKPDLILIPGDIIDTPANRIQDVAAAFRKLKAPLGVFGSTGNHEYYVGLQSAISLLQKGGIKLLMNQTVELSGGGLVIAGIEDRTARGMGRTLPAPQQLLNGKDDSKVKILLNHTPATQDMQAATEGGADLVVCGHTHGGQLWPFNYLTRWAFPLHHGLYPVGDGHVLTTCGIGFWGPPMRLGAPPEIMVIRFVPNSETAEVVWG